MNKEGKLCIFTNHSRYSRKREKFLELGADYMRWTCPVNRAGSVCQDLGTSVKHTKNQLRDYMEKSQPD